MAKATESYCVWITTRRIKPGTYDEFARAWRPETFPEGMLGFTRVTRALPLSDVETKRRQAMARYVVDESSGLYVGRELKIPHD